MTRQAKRKGKRLPKVSIPLPFEKAVEGLLAVKLVLKKDKPKKK